MTIHSVFDLKTGAFTGRTFSADISDAARHAAALAANVPEGCGSIEGEHDHLSYRVDLTSGEVVDWQPPQPSADQEWDAATRRWQLTAVAAARAAAHALALAQIAALEASQHRAMREAALGITASVQRLKDIDAQIAALRKQL